MLLNICHQKVRQTHGMWFESYLNVCEGHKMLGYCIVCSEAVAGATTRPCQSQRCIAGA